jgi:hypothetical protein
VTGSVVSVSGTSRPVAFSVVLSNVSTVFGYR